MVRMATKALLCILAGLFGTVAYAHPALKTAVPAVDGITKDSPKEIHLSFTEKVVAKLSGIDLKDSTGQVIATDTPVIDADDKTHLIIPLHTSLPPGRYEVEWHAVGADTHLAHGHFSFTIEQ
ncbi:copper homeostasis periplasmic binding protein CopC [Beijerinckia indica]|uniref:Copper resistance protein CopC n=1 Tax=Beijerinckia indica subsp. indica (strain ATCC 9039 / DSM 1715 / NCIMB 8712) TaxID=395963 RepID=B2IFD0_BEII9|nr:copper homeostasis periplasmic binding protein CopC [Beijerinckia indica]ACB97030.1 copper resistance protein CopC [Beijerinckia indica subsp. indica ATCC 9039]